MHSKDLWEVFMKSKEGHGYLYTTKAKTEVEAKENARVKIKDLGYDKYEYTIERVIKL